MDKWSSSVKRVQELDFSKKFIISKLVTTREVVNMKYFELRRNYPNLSDEEIYKNINNYVLRDNIFSAGMRMIQKSYICNITEEDINTISKYYRETMPFYKDTNIEKLKIFARQALIKDLILEDLSKYWGIDASNEEAKDVFARMYKASKGTISVRDDVNDEETINRVKKMIIQQKTIDCLLGKLNYVVDWNSIKRSKKNNEN